MLFTRLVSHLLEKLFRYPTRLFHVSPLFVAGRQVLNTRRFRCMQRLRGVCWRISKSTAFKITVGIRNVKTEGAGRECRLGVRLFSIAGNVILMCTNTFGVQMDILYKSRVTQSFRITMIYYPIRKRK